MQANVIAAGSAATAGTIYFSVDLILGAVFVLFYAGTRFNTPSTNRSSTTAGRYFVGLVLYCLAGICFYATLVAFPHLLDFALYGQQMGGDAPTSKISLPLFVALLLTVLLPKIPVLNSVDKWICTQLQNMAAIPWEVLRLSSELRKYKLEFSPEEQAVVRQMLEAEGFDSKDIVFELTETAPSDWTRVTALLQKVEDWSSDRRMAGYLAASNSDLANLRQRYQGLLSKAKTTFNLRDEHDRGETTRKAHQAMVCYEEDFLEHVKQLRKDILEFISRGVLRSELTVRALENRLSSMGFKVTCSQPAFSVNQLLLIFTVVCLTMLPGFIFFGSTGLSFEAILIRLGLVGFTYVTAVACAVLPKSNWRFAQLKAGDVRPIAFYFVAGLMSAAISFITSLVVQAIWMRNLEWALQRSRLTYPWLLVSFATAFLTALMVDNPRFEKISGRTQRCLEGLVQGAVMFGVTYVTCLWLNQRVEVVFKNVDLSYLKYGAPRTLTTMVMGAAVGCVIGFFIPTWYRRHQEQSAQERARSLTLVPSAPARSTQTAISA
jgi:hypothetical protein